MSSLKLRQIGNSLGVVLPKDVLSRLRVVEGDTLHVVETPNGIVLSTLDPKVAEQLEAGRDIMHRYRNTLAALAK